MDRCVNFHNLDTANDGKRLTAFVVFDMTDCLPGQHLPVIDKIREVIDAPTNRMSSSSIRMDRVTDTI